MAVTDEDVARVEKLMELMGKHRVDALSVGDVRLAKSVHLPVDLPKADPKRRLEDVDDEDEDDLYYSAAAS